ncbi:hypothetical protein B0H14DRAFT_2415855 [Mycena olivaceomarginata]|nr:hypothetical protein B0H14DRAFT_2415855 [Mycena olivaceomarginata]
MRQRQRGPCRRHLCNVRTSESTRGNGSPASWVRSGSPSRNSYTPPRGHRRRAAKAELDLIDLVSPPRQKAKRAVASGASQASRGFLGNFLQDFWACYRAVSPDDFETKWQILARRYPTARAYQHDLYQVRDRWAWAWISVVFTAGIRTNGRVEVENHITKVLSGPKKTLFQVFTALNERTQEQQRDENIRVRDSSRKQHPGQLEALFKPILDLLRQHAGPFALQTCFKQMEPTMYLQYYDAALQRPDGMHDWRTRNDFTNDTAYIGTRFLLRLVQEQGLVPTHLLRITHRETGATHIIAILPDGRYICDCCMGNNLGVVCRHKVGKAGKRQGP